MLDIDHVTVGAYMRNTLRVDKNDAREDALFDVYRVMRPGEPPTPEAADAMFNSLFFDSERYDLSSVGRVKMNMRLETPEVGDDIRVLRKDDVLKVLQILVGLKDGRGEIDDIDNLGNRRVRSVGELLENQYRVGLLRMERAIKERMSSVDIDTVMPHDLINAKPAAAAVREFFGSSQLSQFMDQTNPLSEITHKRRLSALGPGGLTRERAGFEVRDVHPTHYGRICPIETPEGPNIGLINSLATHARVNKYGFIESPYRRIKDGKTTEEVVYISAMEEAKYTIAQANIELKDGEIVEDLVPGRINGESQLLPKEAVDMMDVSPKQVVSVAAALIPFLENDDANRALMGANMQRQAVPLVQSDAPLVGTGMEDVVARDSGAVVVARRDGVVEQIDGTRIVVRATSDLEAARSGVDIYRLSKFQRSNQSTCINQRPIVRVGDEVKVGDVIADGPSTDLGELALGRNALVAFMPWNGYNFEDSILISERIVRDDVFTSIHLEEFEVMARDTKLGPGGNHPRHPQRRRGSPAQPRRSGHRGHRRRGARRRHPGGQGHAQGRKPDDAGREAAARHLRRKGLGRARHLPAPAAGRQPAPSSTCGSSTATAWTRTSAPWPSSVRKSNASARTATTSSRSSSATSTRRLQRAAAGQDRRLRSQGPGPRRDHRGQAGRAVARPVVADRPRRREGHGRARGHEEVSSRTARKAPRPSLRGQGREAAARRRTASGRDEDGQGLRGREAQAAARRQDGRPSRQQGGHLQDPADRGHALPRGRHAGRRRAEPAGRALAHEHRPDLRNPPGLGFGRSGQARSRACSRTGQNGGQKKALIERLTDIYGADTPLPQDEDELIELARNLSKGVPFATPVFDGAHISTSRTCWKRPAWTGPASRSLYDGQTGEQFKRPVTVGYIYMLKLHHLVDDKIHARSIGPYSLVTQQPLGGKAQFGGQRFGEMEVWALEAYGAAYTLQEMLTVKSDDVAGRTKVYEAIVRGDDSFEAGIPESFNVLVKEMRSLGLNVELENS